MEKELIVEWWKIFIWAFTLFFLAIVLAITFIRRRQPTKEEVVQQQIKTLIGDTPSELVEKTLEAAPISASKPKSALRWIEKAVGPQPPPKKKKKSNPPRSRSFGRSNKYF